MGNIEELLRKRKELLEEIDRQIEADHTRAVTLLFTDIVGSTGFYERMGDIAGRQMVQTHNDLLFPIIAAHRGRVIKTIGDSIMASFDAAAAALDCTVEMQKAIRGYNAGAQASRTFKVRMGVHCGRAVVEEKDLYGDVVNTAARVESRAAGEEILVSGAVKEGVESYPIPLVFLGSEKVKGREEKVDLYLVNWQGIPEKEAAEAWRARGGKPGPDSGPSPTAAWTGVITKLDVKKELEGIPSLPSRGNPYLNRVMIPHPGMFHGRGSLVKKIMSRLSAQHPQSVSLVGERRIGKSSLLNHLRSPGTRIAHFEDPDAFLQVFIDFQQARTIDEGQFFGLIFAELERKYPGLAGRTPQAGEGEMRRLCEVVSEKGMRMIFLFDEFECVTKNPKIGPEFYSFLRSLANNYPVGFITASGRNLKDMCVTHEISDSPFFNIFSVHHVGLFNPDEALSLVRGPSEARGIPLLPLAQPIIDMGGLYPFFLQMACGAWFEFLEAEEKKAEDFIGKPIPRDVANAFREESRPHFEFICESAGDSERKALVACGASGGAEASNPAAEELERKGYLVRSGDKLVPFSSEFGRFLRELSRTA
jgi:class 3 adenylate cyclase